MLLHGRARLIGPVLSSPPAFVALHRDQDQAVVVGRASRAAILEVASLVDEILSAPEEDQPWVAGSLPNWRHESAVLFRRSPQSPLPKVARGEVRFLAAGELAAFTDRPELLVPSTLGDELRSAESTGTPIAAAFESGRPAAFCYAGSITETLWDVSIDTLEPYRRRGHAMRAVSFLVEHYQAQGKQPVWGALVSNGASASLAARLGFAPVGALSVFSAPRAVDA
jgi:hypothetical protein